MSNFLLVIIKSWYLWFWRNFYKAYYKSTCSSLTHTCINTYMHTCIHLNGHIHTYRPIHIYYLYNFGMEFFMILCLFFLAFLASFFISGSNWYRSSPKFCFKSVTQMHSLLFKYGKSKSIVKIAMKNSYQSSKLSV